MDQIRTRLKKSATGDVSCMSLGAAFEGFENAFKENAAAEG